MDDNKIYLSWTDFHQHCQKLAARIRESNQSFSEIVAVSRGGLLPAGVLAYELDIRRCRSLNIASYDAPGQRRPDEAVECSDLLNLENANTLIVDDLADSGRTFRLLKRWYPEAKFAAVYTKPAGESEVDFYAEKLPDRWVVFPWD